MGLSVMPPEAVYDIERYSEEEICALKPSYCEYNRARGFPITLKGWQGTPPEPPSQPVFMTAAIVLGWSTLDSTAVGCQRER